MRCLTLLSKKKNGRVSSCEARVPENNRREQEVAAVGGAKAVTLRAC